LKSSLPFPCWLSSFIPWCSTQDLEPVWLPLQLSV
jgi:hypothetical protein